MTGTTLDVNGEKFKLLSKIIDNVDLISHGFSVAELIPPINAFLSSSRFLTVAAGGTSFASVLLFPIGAFVSIINAWDTGHRHYSYRAIAYTTTAWSFGHSIPSGSNMLLSNLRTGFPVRPPSVVQEYKQVWQKTSQATLQSLRSECESKKLKKEHLQILFRALGSNRPQELCQTILSGYETKMRQGPEKQTWKSKYYIKYPH